MVYFFHKKLIDSQLLSYSLTTVFGIGLQTAKLLLNQLGIGQAVLTKQVTEEQLNQLYHLIKTQILVKAELKKDIRFDIKRLTAIKSYRGSRHLFGLPVRGQRTHTNNKTKFRT